MPLQPSNNVRGKLHEVALRYGRSRRRRGYNENLLSQKRLRDLGRFFHHRYGSLMLPDDDSGRADLAVTLDHLVWRSDSAVVLRSWVTSWAPWITDSELQTMRDAAGRTWTATDLGTHLGLTDYERTSLKITTIASCGLTEAEWEEKRKERKRQRDRDRLQHKRKAAKVGRQTMRPTRGEDILSLLPRAGWISTSDLSDRVKIFPRRKECLNGR